MAREEDESAGIAGEREIVITRVVNAPRHMVWAAWTDPHQVVQWWGPKGFRTTIETMDVRTGGVWKHVMHGPDGTDYPNKSVFTEVLAPQRIVFACGGGRAGGPGIQFISTWTFEELGPRTRVTIHMIFPSVRERDTVVREYGAVEGGRQTLARLDEHLAVHGRPGAAGAEFLIRRLFAAPREIVFRAFTDPEQMRQWWGPRGAAVGTSNMDLRPGGIYHYGMTMPDGATMWGKFVFREIVEPSRIVFVNSFSDANGGLTRNPFNPGWPLELLSTITFEEEAQGTLLTVRWMPLDSTPAEERAVFAGAKESMQMGWTGTLDQLAGYLAKGAGGA